MERVLLITSNLAQASFRLRAGALVGPLRGRGYDLEVRVRPRSWLARRRLLGSAGGYRAVILQRKLLDPSDARLLRRRARRIIYDVDDAVMRHPAAAGWLSRLRTARRFAATAAIADEVVAGSEHLAEVFRARGRRVTVLPTVVDPRAYRVKSHRADGAPRLVWIGSRSTLPYLRSHLPALEEAARRVSGLSLVVIADAIVSAASLPVENVAWSLDGEAEALSRGDIGIAPTPSDPWTLGKCGFKVVQYMAAGLPVVASPVGANRDLVRPGESGLLPERAEDWPEAIASLARDPDLRSRMGRAGRERVEKEYCLERAVGVWAEVLGRTR